MGHFQRRSTGTHTVSQHGDPEQHHPSIPVTLTVQKQQEPGHGGNLQAIIGTKDYVKRNNNFLYYKKKNFFFIGHKRPWKRMSTSDKYVVTHTGHTVGGE